MSLSELLSTRYSCRAYLPQPVAPDVLHKVFTDARLSPSNCNVQPWQVVVVSGEKKAKLADALVNAVMTQKVPNPDFNWAVAYQNEHRERQFGSANALYGAMGIDRQDKMKRQMAMLRNWQFFDAPHAVFFTMDKYLDIMGAVDLGIYAQTLCLLLKEQGIDSCMQGALGQFPDPVKELCDIPEQRGVMFGMSFGYADPDAPANKARTDRVELDESAVFLN